MGLFLTKCQRCTCTIQQLRNDYESHADAFESFIFQTRQIIMKSYPFGDGTQKAGEKSNGWFQLHRPFQDIGSLEDGVAILWTVDHEMTEL